MHMFHSLPAYIGTKMIGGEPMTKGEFEKIFRRVHPDNSPVEAEGYHVLYENPNGSLYDSWSPKNVFDVAYRLLGGGLTFGDALFFLKQGKKVARSGWNGKGMYLLHVKDTEFSVHFQADLCKGWNNELPQLIGWIGMKTADNKFVPWLASQTDMLCEDWCIVE